MLLQKLFVVIGYFKS